MLQQPRLCIYKHPVDGRLWWYIHPIIIAARVRAIMWPRTTDRLPLLWVRPLTVAEMREALNLMEKTA